MKQQSARYGVGQLIQHKLFNYRGVVVDVDPCFMGSEEWYREMALTRPPRKDPWYRVLVDNAMHETYVAERNLKEDDTAKPIRHPSLEEYFSDFREGTYIPNQRSN